jgi:hypothetical protein
MLRRAATLALVVWALACSTRPRQDGEQAVRAVLNDPGASPESRRAAASVLKQRGGRAADENRQLIDDTLNAPPEPGGGQVIIDPAPAPEIIDGPRDRIMFIE